MLKFMLFLMYFVLMTGNAYAGSIEVFPLLDVQGERDTSILIGVSEEQIKKYLPDGKLHSQIFAFYVKINDKGILFDTGLQDGNIVNELMKNGVSSDEIKTIFITHLHPDHFGGLVNNEGKAAFTNAEIYVSRIEHDYWVKTVKNNSVIEALNVYSGKVHLFEFGDEFFEGIKALDASGHTPGHTAFDIKFEGEELLIVGDILHFIEIQLPCPEISNNYDVNPDKAREARKMILDYASQNEIPIAGMHITSPGIIRLKNTTEDK